jgi:hypothetical protein
MGGEEKCVQTLGTMRGSDIQHRYDVHDETPFFVPEEAHEKNKSNRRPNERSDLGVASKTEWGENRSCHEETWEEGREVSQERRYLHGISNKMMQRQ